MDLVGAWLRQLFKAGTAAALVPAAMVAALVVVLVGAGGFGGLGSLGQILSGPQVSPAEQLAGGPGTAGRDVAPVAPADRRRAPRSRSAPPPRSSAPRPAPQAPDTSPRQPGPAVDPGRPPSSDPPALAPVIVPPPPPPPPPPARPPTLKERTQVLGGKLKETVGDVGTAVQEIVDGLTQTLGRILDPP